MRLVAACIAGGLLVGAGAFYWSASDRRLAEHYRETLAVADGRYFDAAPLTTSSGTEVGHVFAYEGTPSWIVVVLKDAAGVHDVMVTARGTVYGLGPSMVSTPDPSAWGADIPVAVHDLETVIVRPRSGDVEYRAEF